MLIANPGAAILLITRRLEAVDLTHLTIDDPWLLVGLEIGGLGLYGLGYLLMAWALVKLGGNYQLGGSPPRGADEMVMAGPYGLVRHPNVHCGFVHFLGTCWPASIVSLFCRILHLSWVDYLAASR